MRRLLRRIVVLLRLRHYEDELAEEMAFHREMVERETAAHGGGDEAARRATARQFGNATLERDRARDVWIPPALQDLTGDVRFALRLLRKDRGFTFAAVATLALGIGSAGTIFTIFDGMFLKGLPIAHSDRIVELAAVDKRGARLRLSPAQFDDWSASTHAFSHLAAYTSPGIILGDIGDGSRPSERVYASFISAGAFTFVAPHPLVGRGLTATDDRPGAPPVVVLGESVWRQRYDADPHIAGRRVTVNGEPATVIGVMPADFEFPVADKAWLPLAMAPQAADRRRNARTLSVVGQLANGITIAQARAELDAIAARLATQYPETDEGIHAFVDAYTGGFTGFNNPWSDAMLAASFLLLIGCANVASRSSHARPAARAISPSGGRSARRAGASFDSSWSRARSSHRWPPAPARC
jgi:hypothetical protein